MYARRTPTAPHLKACPHLLANRECPNYSGATQPFTAIVARLLTPLVMADG